LPFSLLLLLLMLVLVLVSEEVPLVAAVVAAAAAAAICTVRAEVALIPGPTLTLDETPPILFRFEDRRLTKWLLLPLPPLYPAPDPAPDPALVGLLLLMKGFVLFVLRMLGEWEGEVGAEAETEVGDDKNLEIYVPGGIPAGELSRPPARVFLMARS